MVEARKAIGDLVAGSRQDWIADHSDPDKKQNARKLPISYDLVPLRMGNARHYGEKEECTHHDFWVTANRKGELSYPMVPEYVKKGRKIMNADVTAY